MQGTAIAVEPIIDLNGDPEQIAKDAATLIKGGCGQVCFHNTPKTKEKNVQVFSLLRRNFDEVVYTSITPDGFRVRPSCCNPQK